MKKGVIILLFALLSCQRAISQDLKDYRYYKLFEDSENIESLKTESADTVLLQPQLHHSFRSIFESIASVVNDRHGIAYYDRKRFIAAIELTTGSPNRIMRLGFIPHTIEGTECEYYSVDTTLIERTSVGINLSTKSYIGGIMASTRHRVADNWILSTDISFKTGRDSHVKGVFTNEASLNIGVVGTPDSVSRVVLALFCTPYERAARRASVAETFRLTGDNYYNPSWGYQASKVRSSNVRTSILPTLVASYSRTISTSTELTFSAGATVGVEGYGSIDWMGARNPLPDHYSKLPSYLEGQTGFSEVEKAWIVNDSNYTQINFDELYNRNRLQSEALYVMSNRIEQKSIIELSAFAKTRLSDASSLVYGARAKYDNSRNYKQLTDMLGGTPFADIDYFLVDDDTFSNLFENNMHNVGRKVSKGSRYGYDYSLKTLTADIFASFSYKKGSFDFGADATLGIERVYRVGHFQKELFADNSYGHSRKIDLSPLSARAVSRYRLSNQSSFYGLLAFAMDAPTADNLFLQPQYNNRVIDNPSLTQLYTAEFGYRFCTNRVLVNTTLFARYWNNNIQTGQLYDDISMVFADVVTSNIQTIACGVEAEASYDFAQHWNITGGVSIGKYAYINNPTVTIYADTDNQIIQERMPSKMKGLSTGRTPEISALSRIEYYSHGWGVSIGGEFHARRYIAPSYVRRTERVTNHTHNEEQLNTILRQERLANAFTCDFTLSKSIYLKRFDKRVYISQVGARFTDRHPRSRIILFLSIDNLLANRNIIYRGYESTRLRKYYSQNRYTLEPRPSYYLYAYPRTIYFQARFTF